ncbi:histone-lysine N-methyltransferase 2D-like [Alligator mississippiensis]|uniref:Histone-lysine N-methyltransferase 2D-like n=1 Tax=Alligator mississippiensis TaxID=8496 RepID=A0A151NZC1_ALLMI|nr:histone-lysine N-methyltransferase 2D-like [Alligator mississippiensis]
MDEQKPPSEDKDSEAPADGAASSEEQGSAEGDPLKPPEVVPATREPGSTETKRPPQPCSTLPWRCALCNCGDWSRLGQRELQRFEPGPNWTEQPQGQEGPGEVPAAEDDLSQIGFTEGVTLRQISEPTGHCWVHHWCAAWSAGVQRQDGAGLNDVDKAVFSGISQKCERCQRMGATLQCHSEGCPRRYHFPCAAASGSFQSMKTLRLLCPEHLAEAAQMEDSRCVVCDGPGELRDLLFCTSCGLHYHGACLEITVTPRKRAGWQCPECKVCQTCRQPGEDSMMLVCEACDKGYHTFCMKPAIESLPTDSWKCKNCRVCSDCGRRPAALNPACQWYENYSVCEGCQEQRRRSTEGSQAGEAEAPPCDQHSPLPMACIDSAGPPVPPSPAGHDPPVPSPLPQARSPAAEPQDKLPAADEAKPPDPDSKAEEPEEPPALAPEVPAKEEAMEVELEPLPPTATPAPSPPAPPGEGQAHQGRGLCTRLPQGMLGPTL